MRATPLALLLAAAARAAPEPVLIETSSALRVTGADFVCVTLDWWPDDKACVDGSRCWAGASALNLDLAHPTLTSALRAQQKLTAADAKLRKVLVTAERALEAEGAELRRQVLLFKGRARSAEDSAKFKETLLAEKRANFKKKGLALRDYDAVREFKTTKKKDLDLQTCALTLHATAGSKQRALTLQFDGGATAQSTKARDDWLAALFRGHEG